MYKIFSNKKDNPSSANYAEGGSVSHYGYDQYLEFGTLELFM